MKKLYICLKLYINKSNKKVSKIVTSRNNPYEVCKNRRKRAVNGL
jgi:hypothetical protein